MKKIIAKGTTVHVKGIPFKLVSSTKIEGNKSNFVLIKEYLSTATKLGNSHSQRTREKISRSMRDTWREWKNEHD